MVRAPAVQVWPQPGLKDCLCLAVSARTERIEHLQQGEDPTPHRHNCVLLQ